MKEVEEQLLSVARNVAKHVVQRSGWVPDDECFQVDLREAQAAIERLIAGRAAEEREACVALILQHLCCSDQRGVSWAEVQGAIKAIRGRGEGGR